MAKVSFLPFAVNVMLNLSILLTAVTVAQVVDDRHDKILNRTS